MMMERQGRKTLSTEARKQVVLQSKTSITDGQGGFTETYAGTTKRWASISPLQARQINDYKSTGVDASHLIKMRGGVDVVEADRIVFGQRIFEVLTAENIQERSVMWVLLCKERR